MSVFIKTGVIGHPISHSKSPIIHNYWIETYGLNGQYEAIDLSPEKLKRGVFDLIEQGYTGFNFTLPHKEAALALCDEVDADAEHLIGAVNTIVVKEGKVKGSNTDPFGFWENILEAAPEFDAADGPAVVIGAGGAARSVIAVLKSDCPEIRIVNRTRERAEKIISDLDYDAYEGEIKLIDWDDLSKALDGANLLVNTTSLGMKNQPPLEIDLSLLPENALVNDIVYAPLMTDLLQQAEVRGNKIVTGIGMLLHQARPGFQSWYGVEPQITEELKARVTA